MNTVQCIFSLCCIWTALEWENKSTSSLAPSFRQRTLNKCETLLRIYHSPPELMIYTKVRPRDETRQEPPEPIRAQRRSNSCSELKTTSSHLQPKPKPLKKYNTTPNRRMIEEKKKDGSRAADSPRAGRCTTPRGAWGGLCCSPWGSRSCTADRRRRPAGRPEGSRKGGGGDAGRLWRLKVKIA